MAQLKRKDIYEGGNPFEDIQKALNELIKAEQDLKKQNDELIKSYRNISKNNTGKSAKELIQYTEKQSVVNAKLETTQKALTALEKERLSIDKKLEKVIAQKTVSTEKNNKTLLKEREALKEKNKATREEIQLEKALKQKIDEEGKTIKDLQRINKNLTIQRKNQARGTKEEKKQFEKLTKAIKANEDKLKGFDKEIGRNQKNVGNYKSAFGKVGSILGSFGLALGGAQIAMNLFNGVVSSSQIAGDAWTKTMAGMKGALDGFFKAIGTGQFDKVLEFMRNGKKAAEEYSVAMDDLFEGGQGAKLQIAEINKKIVKLETDRKKALAAKDYDKVIASAKALGEAESEKLKIIQEENVRLFEAESNHLKGVTGLDKDRFISFLKNWRSEEGLRKKANEYLEQKAALETRVNQQIYSNRGVEFSGAKKDRDRAILQLKTLEETTSSTIKTQAKIITEYGATTDEIVQKTVDAYLKVQEAQISSIKQQQRNEVALVTAQRYKSEAEAKAAKEKAKQDEENAKKDFLREESLTNSTIKNVNVRLRTEKDAQNEIAKRDEKLKKETVKRTEAQLAKEKALKDKALAEDLARQKANTEAWQQLSNDSINTMFSMFAQVTLMSDAAKKEVGDYNQQILLMALDTTAKIIELAIAQIIAKELGEKSFVGIATAAVLTGIVEGAFQAAKANILANNKQQYAEGGEVHGGGTATSDSIDAKLSNGEFVVKASAYKDAKILTNAINKGYLKDSNFHNIKNTNNLNDLYLRKIASNTENNAYTYEKDGFIYVQFANGSTKKILK